MKLIKNSIYTVFTLFLFFSSTSLIATENRSEASPHFKNEELLNSLFDKLRNLENGGQGKVNIVHIGDSHVQADFFTDVIRQVLQYRFGNGGYGFTFPYSLAKTNGSHYISYRSDAEWESVRNIAPVSDVAVGLSGIGLYTKSNNFFIELQAKNIYRFNTIKLLYPTKQPAFNLALPGDSVIVLSQQNVLPTRQSNTVRYTVKKGETLYRISVRNNISVDRLKQVNNLKSNNIREGQKLIIPQKNTSATQSQTSKASAQIAIRDTLQLENNQYVSVYHNAEPLSEIFILPNKRFRTYNLNGIVLEDDQAGVIYHSIGVNGTKTSDYNKYPLFFDQFTVLNPDLIIISLGTNESFGRWSDSEYMYQMNKLVSNLRKNHFDTPILIMTPPPSLFKRTVPNDFVRDYSEALLEMNNCIIWDLFSRMGGINAPMKKSNAPLMARDKVHYTKEGYEKQGNIFSADFIETYNNYIKKNNQ